MSEARYIAVAGQIVGTLQDWRMAWSWDGTRWDERQAAIDHGLATFGSDDFLIGVLDGAGQVTALVWMDEDDREQDADEISEVNRQLVLPAPCPDDCAAHLAAALLEDGNEVTVSPDPPTEYVPGARCWRCRHGARWYTTPAGVGG